MEWGLDFISEKNFTNHVAATIEKYGEKLESFDIKRFNKNIIDPIKLIFDKTVYRSSWEEMVGNEIFRQRDKSNNNDIGYFHQRIFQYIKNCHVPDNGKEGGWDVIFQSEDGIQLPDGDMVHTVYVEMKNKHNTMNSASAGIHLMSYGRDLRSGTDIRDAVRCFDGLNNIKRIRFGSLEPHMMTDEIIAELADNKRICRQFHLSLQSGSDTVLERMRRGYTSGQYFELCQKLRRAFGGETAVTTDIIAGFPGETEEEHLETIEFMRKVGFAKVHIFPYSRRSGTKADAMPGQLSNAEKSRRAGELIAVGRESEHEYLEQYVGETVNVLIEKCVDNVSYGCTDTYAAVRINSAITPNTFADVKIKYIKEDMNGELYLL